ncbi:IS66 family insertion sequence element accessory protein TnpB [Halioxenophilus sp. WMMB6]|uniref:IS66 family insertion sequence element accessory protein TnpB n=1 Tax=Halioxenophilus sp. WMMB6 TaxID=3073815 RepID=UPI00295ED7F6|nr:IS66 family insertion sequence element accessory protein TnpB [Halioxenophilus sp. WMMB6]
MIDWHSDIPIYLHKAQVDFRKSINGLSVIVAESMHLSVTEPGLFVFCNKSRRQLKVLYWDSTGFALWQKRLERDRFKWPSDERFNVVTLNHEQWCWLLRGFDITKISPHSPIFYRDEV